MTAFLKLGRVMFYLPAGLFIFLSLCGFVGLWQPVISQSLPHDEIMGQFIVAYLLLGLAWGWCKVMDTIVPEFE